MADLLSRLCTAFVGPRRIARGPLIEVALALKPFEDDGPLLFDDRSGAVIDLDLRGETADIVARLSERARKEGAVVRPRRPAEDGAPARGRGRPKLGVVAREVTLLPRHWEWLAAQPGGASQALRRLVDQARRGDDGRTERKAAKERAYRFMSTMAGDLPGFEEASRALFADDRAAIELRMAAWPADIGAHVRALLAIDEGTMP